MGEIAKKYNLKSPAVKRLMREAAELSDPTDQYFAQPLEDNLFEWHFTVRGSPDTEFEDGRYHGRITLPPEYPMKPPSIILLTPNGRFETGKKICLSMSAHHPETWQPSWSIRTVLLALIGFMPTAGGGAIGALDHAPEERKVLARRSRNWKCEACGSDNRTCLLERDLSKEKEERQEVEELASQISFKGENKDNTKKDHQTSSASNPATSVPPQFQYPQHQIPPQHMYGNFQQYYGMPNPYLNQNPPSTASPTSSYPQDQQSAVTSSQNPSTTPTTTTPTSTLTSADDNTATATSDNETNLRQRIRTEIDNNDDETTSLSPSDEPSARPQQPQTRAERVSLFLMWIVSALLVLLIIRRLAMEGTSMG